MPLLFDMPLEQLKTYEGLNPRPDDFDAFWDYAHEALPGTSDRIFQFMQRL